jgi:hypothetical protein
MEVRPTDVFAVLRDGYSYDSWVVGARAIRSVEDGWPDVDAKLHYTVGYGLLRKDDQTQVLAVTPDRCLELRAHAWPAGTARIILEIEPVAGGYLVSMDEYPDQGVAKQLHNPVLDKIIQLRNVETLRRLNKLAAGHASPR